MSAATPDYSRLVFSEHSEDSEHAYYYPHVGPSEGLCENCYFDADPRTGEQQVWTPLVYDDAELTILQNQTGGNVSFCASCIDEQILATYRGEMPGRWFVRPAGPLAEPTKIYGGC